MGEETSSKARFFFMRPPWRLPIWFVTGLLVGYLLWQPGTLPEDGRHDRGKNGIWISHGWMGDDAWFARHNKNRDEYRSEASIRNLADKLRQNHITDVFPHLCPALPNGKIPQVDDEQVERLVKMLEGVRVIPWVGAPNGDVETIYSDTRWRKRFCESIAGLLEAHPGLAGIHVNIEPCRSGDVDFLTLLEELRAILPKGKILSVAAYPPPTIWQPVPEIHWDEAYFREVSQRVDQVAVMMYDTALRWEKPYISLMAIWTREILNWSGRAEVLLGVPVYDDSGTTYHFPHVENLKNGLKGIHSGLNGFGQLPENYQGVAIYCEWEMEPEEWKFFQKYFLKK
jgi:hypothetical protein